MFDVTHYTDFLRKEETRYLFDTLYNSTDYDDPELTAITIYGKKTAIPRRQMSFGEKVYSFVGTHIEPKPIPDYLKPLLEKVNDICHTSFNHILVNLYRDGNDYIGYHRDKHIDETPIASISLGATRDFIFTNGTETKEFILTDGTLLIIHPPTNVYWKHSLPKRMKVKEPRINITFRVV